MKCIAIDDEPLALGIIKNFCQRLDGMELETFSDPVIGMERVKENVPDILFLDIEMNGVSGLDIARTLPKGVFLIFTTAYSQFALDGFELNAVDFLHKPFSFARFEKAVSKAMELKRLYEKSEVKDETGAEITVKVEYQNVKVPVGEILYVEAMDSYVKIYTKETRPVITQMSMKSVMEMLPEGEFIRIHKSYIVNRNKVQSYTRNKVIMAVKGVELPVGRVYARDFAECMQVREER